MRRRATTWFAYLSLVVGAWIFDCESMAQSPSGGPTPILREFNVRIPMRDGVMLSADIYRPAASSSVPVVLVRTPYTKSDVAAASGVDYAHQGRWWAEHGYAFVVQDVRGRGDSEGLFYPLVNEAKDGFDTLEWLGRQPWSTGRVGMLGTSYRGWTQVYAAAERSPFLKAIIPTVTPPDPDRYFPVNSGVVVLPSLAWLAGIDGHTQQSVLSQLSPDVLDSSYRALPLLTLDAAIGRNLPAWRDWVSHPTHDAYWQAQSYQRKLLDAQIPALHVSGWYDSMLVGATENFTNMSERARDPQTRRQQRLIIGPWQHHLNAERRIGAIDFGSQALIDLRGIQLRWFDHWLKELDNGVDREPRVRLFVMGIDQWVSENEWPIARTSYVKYYLHSRGGANSRWGDGRLNRAVPASQPPDRFRYDPADPVIFPGKLTDLRTAFPGPDDMREVEARHDVLVYTSAELTEPLRICGPLRVRLFAMTNVVDTDWTARVVDVFPDGFAQRLNDGIVRSRFRLRHDQAVLLEPNQPYRYDIDLMSTCIELQAGHRIRLEISSSAFPLYDRNLNTGGTQGGAVRGVIAEQKVLHDRRHASYLLLPVIGN